MINLAIIRLKRIISWLKRLALVFVTFLLCLTLGYFMPRPWHLQVSEPCGIEIAVISDGFHTNLVVPVSHPLFDWRSRLAVDRLGYEPRSDYRYLVIGWGDQQFYLNTPRRQDFRLTEGLRAMFGWQNPTVLHLQGLPELSPRAGQTLRRILLSRGNYLRLVTFVLQSFKLSGQGEMRRVADRRWSSFYAAIGHYSILYTCNSWTARALASAQVPTPMWDALAGSVMHHLKNACRLEPPTGSRQQ